MKLTLRILSSLGIFLLLGGIIFLFFIPAPLPDTRFASISQQSINDDIEIIGRIKSENQYTLFSQAEGVIRKLSVHLGDDVSKGQLLAKINKDQDIKIDSQTESRLQSTVSQYRLAMQQSRDKLQRIRNAVNAGVLPHYKLDEVNASFQRARAQQLAAQNELNSYQTDKNTERKITHKQTLINNALSNGIIAKKLAYNGQWLRKGDPILSIISTDDLTIKAMMSPQQVNKLILGQKVIASKQDSEATWSEQIVQISPIISQNPNTKNLQEVTISLVNADDIEKSINEKIKLKIISNTSNNFNNSLPIEAVIRDGKKFHILTIDRNNKASISDIYQRKGLISALQQLKCQFSSCNTVSMAYQRNRF